MASFSKAQEIVKINEGGYSTNVNDRGNYLNLADFNAKRNFIGTNWGIAAPTLSNWLGRDATQQDMKSLTYATALKIYKKNFWDKIRGDKIANQSIANIIYDGAVNQGVGAAFDFVSKATGYPSSPRRSPFPDEMINLVNSGDSQKMFDKVKQARIDRYSTSDRYYEGHMRRVAKFLYEKGTQMVKKNYLRILAIGVGVSAVISLIIVFVKKANKK